MKRVSSAELRAVFGQLTLLWSDEQFGNEQLSKIGRNGALHLRKVDPTV